MPEVVYLFDYEREFFPASGPGKNLGRPAKLMGEGRARLRVAEPSECPVVARLAVPGRPETLDLRLVDGRLARPVCAPGTKRPCRLDEFVEAAKGLLPWRDSPFFGPTYPTNPAEIPQVTSMEACGARKWGTTTEDARRVAIAERLVGMTVVGDVVYVVCDEPTLEPFIVEGAAPRFDRGLAVGWSFPDMDAFSDPENGQNKRVGIHVLHRKSGFPCGIYVPEGLATFRLDREADARAYLGALAESEGMSLLRAYLKEGWPAELAATEDTVAYVDASLLDSGDDASRVLSAARAQVSDGTAWSHLSRMPSDAITAWAAARDLLATPDEEMSSDVLREAMDAYCTACEGTYPQTEHWRGDALAVRWRTVERDRDFALPQEGDADVDYVSAMG